MSEEMERLRGKPHKVAGIALDEVPFPPENDEGAVAHMQLVEQIKTRTMPLRGDVKAAEAFVKGLEEDLGNYFRERRRAAKSGEVQHTVQEHERKAGPRRAGS